MSDRNAWLQSFRQRNCIIDATFQITGDSLIYSSIQFGNGCVVEPDITVWMSLDTGADARLALGDKVFVGRNTYIGVYQPITVGMDTMIGAYSYIISGNHCYERRDIPMREQGFSGAPIIIADDVWIGTHVVVLPGVTIGKGAIIGAGSIVNRNVPEYEIWAGAPAKFIKQRPK